MANGKEGRTKGDCYEWLVGNPRFLAGLTWRTKVYVMVRNIN